MEQFWPRLDAQPSLGLLLPRWPLWPLWWLERARLLGLRAALLISSSKRSFVLLRSVSTAITIASNETARLVSSSAPALVLPRSTSFTVALP